MNGGDINQQFRNQFIAEAEDHLVTVESNLLIIERDLQKVEAFREILRALHSLKGISGVILSLINQESGQGYHYLEGFRSIAHLCESLVQRIRDNHKEADDSIPLLFQGLDQLKELLNVYHHNKKMIPDFQPTITDMQDRLLICTNECSVSIQGKEIPISIFADILEQNLQLLEAGLEQLEQGVDRMKVHNLCNRGIKALKGVAKKADYPWLDLFISDCVTFFSLDQENNQESGVQEIRGKIDGVRAKALGRVSTTVVPQHTSRVEPTDNAQLPSSLESGERSIRLSQDKIDDLMNLIVELKIQSNALQTGWTALEQMSESNDHLNRLQPVVESICRLSADLQNDFMSIRLLPISLVFARFPRLVRDLCVKLSKQVNLVLVGEETVIDKNIIESLFDPLNHMVRNAVDHGIEGFEERTMLGKTTYGTIELKAYNQGQRVVIELSDDGRGLDAAKIRDKAATKRICDLKQLEMMDENQLFQLLFTPGFSTSDTVNEISGRGVGLDVVKTNITRIGGTIETQSQLGKGTRFIIHVPLTLAIGKGLLVGCQGQHFYLPIDIILETMSLDPNTLFLYKGKEAIVVRESLLRAYRLNLLLGYRGNDLVSTKDQKGLKKENKQVLILEINRVKLALIVDSCYEEAEYMVKPIKGLVEDGAGFSGSMITADGTVILVLDIAALLTRFDRT